MITASQIKPNTPVVCSNNGQLAVVDHMEERQAQRHPALKYEPISHVSMVLRQASEGWRVIHFHESTRSARAAQIVQAVQAKPRSR
jgi:hypothetical protein